MCAAASVFSFPRHVEAPRCGSLEEAAFKEREWPVSQRLRSCRRRLPYTPFTASDSARRPGSRPPASPMRLHHRKLIRRLIFDGLLEDEMWSDPLFGQRVEQPLIVDVAIHRKGLVPNAVGRLSEMEFDDPVVVVVQCVEHSDLGVSAAAKNPVGVEAELYVLGIGCGEHVMKFAAALTELGVMVVIGEYDVKVS